jgi:hypothetical protein
VKISTINFRNENGNNGGLSELATHLNSRTPALKFKKSLGLGV